MKETETFYWKNETGDIEAHHISEFRTFLEKGEGRCVTGMEYQQETSSYPKPPYVQWVLAWSLLLAWGEKTPS